MTFGDQKSQLLGKRRLVLRMLFGSFVDIHVLVHDIRHTKRVHETIPNTKQIFSNKNCYLI